MVICDKIVDRVTLEEIIYELIKILFFRLFVDIVLNYMVLFLIVGFVIVAFADDGFFGLLHYSYK